VVHLVEGSEDADEDVIVAIAYTLFSYGTGGFLCEHPVKDGGFHKTHLEGRFLKGRRKGQITELSQKTLKKGI